MSDIREKIKGLLNIAKDDAASEAEIENALKIATKLMERHQLSESDLVEDPVEQGKRVVEAPKTKKGSKVGSKIFTWEITLAAVIRDYVVPGVGAFTMKSPSVTPSGIIQRDESGKPKMAGEIVFYGVEEDVEIANRVFTEIRLAIIALARIRYGSVFRGDGAAYAEGFCLGILEKLKEQQRAEKAQATIEAGQSQSTGLILIARRDELTRLKRQSSDRWLASPTGGGAKLTKGQARAGSAGSADARETGKSDGRGYQVDGSRRAKLS